MVIQKLVLLFSLLLRYLVRDPLSLLKRLLFLLVTVLAALRQAAEALIVQMELVILEQLQCLVMALLLPSKSFILTLEYPGLLSALARLQLELDLIPVLYL